MVVPLCVYAVSLYGDIDIVLDVVDSVFFRLRLPDHESKKQGSNAKQEGFHDKCTR